VDLLQVVFLGGLLLSLVLALADQFAKRSHLLSGGGCVAV
jgi:hypothetical protein